MVNVDQDQIELEGTKILQRKLKFLDDEGPVFESKSQGLFYKNKNIIENCIWLISFTSFACAKMFMIIQNPELEWIEIVTVVMSLLTPLICLLNFKITHMWTVLLIGSGVFVV